jgi:cytochrome c-type biogenesis protein CcmH/NrfF
MNDQKSGSMNTVLMAVVGLLIGFIGGYFIGQHNSPATSQALLAQTANTTTLPPQLQSKDEWIVAGFRCPNTDTVQISVLDCQCYVSRGIKDHVNAELTAGKTGDQIRSELLMQYGDRLKFHGQ